MVCRERIGVAVQEHGDCDPRHAPWGARDAPANAVVMMTCPAIWLFPASSAAARSVSNGTRILGVALMPGSSRHCAQAHAPAAHRLSGPDGSGARRGNSPDATKDAGP